MTLPNIEGYEIETLISRGSFSRVYRAKQLSLGRQVALKVINDEVIESAWNRFKAELSILARLEHISQSAIVPVYDAKDTDENSWISMRFISQGSLAVIIKNQGHLDATQAIELFIPVALALDTIHNEGIFHRDIKPGNLLFDGERLLLADFGIALLAGEARYTQEGVIGSPPYLSPERWDNKDPSSADDLWGLTVSLWEALHGKCPFSMNSTGTPITQVLQKNDIKPTVDIDKPLADFFRRSLSTDPKDRYKTGKEWATELTTIIKSAQPSFDTTHNWVVTKGPQETTEPNRLDSKTQSYLIRDCIILPPSELSTSALATNLDEEIINKFITPPSKPNTQTISPDMVPWIKRIESFPKLRKTLAKRIAEHLLVGALTLIGVYIALFMIVIVGNKTTVSQLQLLLSLILGVWTPSLIISLGYDINSWYKGHLSNLKWEEERRWHLYLLLGDIGAITTGIYYLFFPYTNYVPMFFWIIGPLSMALANIGNSIFKSMKIKGSSSGQIAEQK